MKPKIIRALWGKQEHTLNEVPESPLFDNEIVFVWGDENNTFLKERG